MVIEVSNLRRPGIIYDSSKLAILGNLISGSINQRTQGKYVAKSTIKGKTIRISLKRRKESGQLVRPNGNEQEILAGRVSSFLNTQGISHDIQVK